MIFVASTIFNTTVNRLLIISFFAVIPLNFLYLSKFYTYFFFNYYIYIINFRSIF